MLLACLNRFFIQPQLHLDNHLFIPRGSPHFLAFDKQVFYHIKSGVNPIKNFFNNYQENKYEYQNFPCA